MSDTGFGNLTDRLRAGVESLAASLGVEVNGELHGIVSDPGRAREGVGFAVAVGTGLPEGWQAEKKPTVAEDLIAGFTELADSLEAEARRGWTRERPTVEGWYWVRFAGWPDEPEAVYQGQLSDGTWVPHYTDDYAREWWGPLEVPQ